MQRGASSELDNETNDFRPMQDIADDSNAICESKKNESPSEHLNTDLQPAENGSHFIKSESPRGKKRKFTEPSTGKRSRHVSPPWKKVAVEGPTSFIEDGRRKSSRTNTIPLELQPPAGSRQTRAGHLRKAERTKSERVVQSASKLRNLTDASTKRASLHDGAQTTQSGHASGARGSQPFRPQQRVKERPTRSSRRSPSLKMEDSSQQGSLTQSPVLSQRRDTRQRSCGDPEEEADDATRDELRPKKSATSSPTVYKPVKSLRLHFRRPPLPILNPANLAHARQHATLKAFLAEDDPLEGEDEQRLGDDEAKREAMILLKLEEAARPGGLLSGEHWAGETADRQEEPRAQYTHPDYLLKHVVDFQPRLERERLQHVALAKKLAQLALAEWKRRQPKSEAEKWAEDRARQELVYKRMLKELGSQWDTVKTHVKRQKLAEYMEEQEVEKKNVLKKMIGNAKHLISGRKQPRTHLGEDTGGQSDSDDNDQATDSAGYGSAAEDSDNSSRDTSTGADSDTTDPSESDAGSGDNNLSVEELREKYRKIPNTEQTLVDEDPSRTLRSKRLSEQTWAISDEVADAFDPFVQEIAEGITGTAAMSPPLPTSTFPNSLDSIDVVAAQCELEEVADALLESDDDDDDNEDTDRSDDDDDDSGDEPESENDQEEEEDEDEDTDPYGDLLGFYNRVQQREFHAHELVENPDSEVLTKDGPESQPMELDEADGSHTSTAAFLGNPKSVISYPDIDQGTPSFNGTSGDASRQLTPATTHTGKPSEAESMTTPEPFEDIEAVVEGMTSEPENITTEVSPLLRGDLRVYQHAGVDWLAGMYANRTNGILADEMGLGKTIQTIALLSHLATSHHVWGPHLVVVPTSVILNWELEFKKWCPGFKILTYYGTQEERKLKRKGWMDDDRWNVCITSYQLVIQDAVALKRRNWHYMILDEAHNIKNFRSLRWQTLLNFKTEARLLLTGTPLQNNLTELWSLLSFLTGGHREQGDFTFGDLDVFQNAFNKPVEQILEHGREDLDDHAREVVTKLHKVLRPHLLRRLKADVEKQMPKKYEHIVKCRLSKRQRQLYDGYMGLTGTRESFQSGNYLSIINCLMQLRKVCNHPDLFETRQIVTSYAMPKSAIADYEITELLVRKRLLEDHATEDANKCVISLWSHNIATTGKTRDKASAAQGHFNEAIQRQKFTIQLRSTIPSHQTVETALLQVAGQSRQARVSELLNQCRLTAARCERRPVYSIGMLQRLQIFNMHKPGKDATIADSDESSTQYGNLQFFEELIINPSQRAQMLSTIIKTFACITPAVVAPGLDRLALTDNGGAAISRIQEEVSIDPYHEALTRLSIAFPDKSLIQYDCGKFQALDRLLRKLQAGGHRALIFTQMTKVLDLLEQFLNLHGHLYLRLDGTTRVEQRQILTDRFNKDTRILAFILSSRSGGLGINLTGADTVIFYDLDWNPAMDKQCQDRCHRIGQTRDVHIYRFVSEGTIEANILRKSNQKRMLDNVVIQEGDFTTDYFNKIDPREFLDNDAEADAALDKLLGGSGTRVDSILEQAEDLEDREAAKEAQKEIVNTDEGDFEELTGPAEEGTPRTRAPSTPFAAGSVPPSGNVSSPANAAGETMQDVEMLDVAPMEEAPTDRGEEDEEEPGSHEEYMLRHMTWELRDVVIKPRPDNTKQKSRKTKRT